MKLINTGILGIMVMALAGCGSMPSVNVDKWSATFELAAQAAAYVTIKDDPGTRDGFIAAARELERVVEAGGVTPEHVAAAMFYVSQKPEVILAVNSTITLYRIWWNENNFDGIPVNNLGKGILSGIARGFRLGAGGSEPEYSETVASSRSTHKLDRAFNEHFEKFPVR